MYEDQGFAIPIVLLLQTCNQLIPIFIWFMISKILFVSGLEVYFYVILARYMKKFNNMYPRRNVVRYVPAEDAVHM